VNRAASHEPLRATSGTTPFLSSQLQAEEATAGIEQCVRIAECACADGSTAFSENQPRYILVLRIRCWTSSPEE
jgi:hypothetical protein